ncbi:hypothetical protein JHK86_004759 [Glycine max]|nr:hypothetical protein JHK86_004759 [Glycine max]
MNKGRWMSLIRHQDRPSFRPFTTSYKNFKVGFFKVVFLPILGDNHFYDMNKKPLFPFYWQQVLRRYDDYPVSYLTDSEREEFLDDEDEEGIVVTLGDGGGLCCIGGISGIKGGLKKSKIIWKCLEEKDDEYKSKSLTFFGRIMHWNNMHFVFPSVGTFQEVNDHDLLVIYYLWKKIPLSLPYLIINHIIKAIKPIKSTSGVPYGILMTLIFKHYGVLLEDEAKDEETLLGPKIRFKRKIEKE